MGSIENVNANDFDSFLIEGVDPVTPGIEGATIDDGEDYVLTPADESAIFLEALACECATSDEFFNLVEDNAVALEMYGVIEDASAALEAVKRMKVDNWKQVNLSRVTGNQAIRMAAAENGGKGSPDYRKYKKYKALFIKYKKKIESKYAHRAKSAARRSIQNSQHKVASVKNSPAAVGMTKKLDNTLKHLNKDGRNGTAIRENGK